MEEKRYSVRATAKIICMHPMTVYNRAKRLGIDTSKGLTVEDVKRIRDYKPKWSYMSRGEELKEEFESLK